MLSEMARVAKPGGQVAWWLPTAASFGEFFSIYWEALQNAGLKTGDQGLEFSLRDQSGSRHQQDNDAPRGNRVVIPDEVQPLAGATYGRRLGLGYGLDIRV